MEEKNYKLANKMKDQCLLLTNSINNNISIGQDDQPTMLPQHRLSPMSSRYSYHTLFSDICKTRFNHLVTRLFLVAIIFETFMITILSCGYHITFENVLMLIPRFILLYSVSICIIIARKNYLHVKSLGYSNWGTQILGQLISIRFLVYQLIYSSCTFAIALALGDCFGLSQLSAQKNGLIYRLFVWILIPLIYNLQHSLLDNDKLSFAFESQVNLPQTYIADRTKKMVARAFMLAVVLTIFSPLVSSSFSSTHFIGFVATFKLMILSFWVMVNFQFINLAFDAHMSIGCLHKGKPISSLSKMPMETLLNGLSSKKAFTKLTAFQELCYRATSPDLSLRLPIYNSTSRKSVNENSNIWPDILRECLLVIQEDNESVTKYLNQVEVRNKSIFTRKEEPTYLDPRVSQQDIFGKSESGNMNTLVGGVASQPSNITRRVPIRDDNILLTPQRRNVGREIRSPSRFDENILTHETKLSLFLKDVSARIKATITIIFFPSATITTSSGTPIVETHLSLWDSWFASKGKVADKLVPLPVCHAESVISLMALLINAVDESPRGNVIASVGDVLKCLQRSVSVLGRFDEWDMENPKRKCRRSGLEEDSELDVVGILYNLSISAFLEVVIKFDGLLADISLDEDVVKLTNWVLDMVDSQFPARY